MTHQRISIALEDLRVAQMDFWNLTCEFYLQLVNKMVKEMEIPNGSLIKYEKDSDQNCNVIEKCVSIDDCIATFNVGLIVDEIQQDITFKTRKNKSNQVALQVIIDDCQHEFLFDIADKSNISTLDFSNVFDYITHVIIKQFKDAEDAFRVI